MRATVVALVVAAVLLGCNSNAPATGSGSGGPPDGGTGPVKRTLTIHVSGNGDVHAASFDCRSSCQRQFDDGQQIHLDLIPDSGWKFDGWQGDCSGTAACDLTMSADRSVAASFSAAPPPPPSGSVWVTVMFTGSGGGRVTSSPGGIDCPGTCSMTVTTGAAVSLTAQADGNSTFVGWGGACSGGSCNFTANGNSTAWANFQSNAPPPPPPPDECANLRPGNPGAAQGRHAIQAYRVDCRQGLTDGSGMLALSTFDTSTRRQGSIDFVNLSGSTVNSSSGTSALLTSQLSGFEGMVYRPEQPQDNWWQLQVWTSAGQTTAQFAIPNANALTEDPLGGVVVLAYTNSGPVLTSYDANGAFRWSASFPSGGPVVAFTVDRAGNTLVLLETISQSVNGQWIDHSGAKGPVFPVLPPQTTPPHLRGYVLTQRVGSGFFVGHDGGWTDQIDSLATFMSPAPIWLQAQPQTRLHMVHGGGGYGVLPPTAASSDCTQDIEVIAPSGTVCGKATFAWGSGGSCSTRSIDIGYDGTVIQQSPGTWCDSSGNCTCSWQWWPQFFH